MFSKGQPDLSATSFANAIDVIFFIMYKTVVVLVVLFLTENETYKSSVASESYKDMETCRAELDKGN